MGRAAQAVRRRPGGQAEVPSEGAELQTEMRKVTWGFAMPAWWHRIFFPYRLLLLFSLAVCLLQILVGISFSHTFSSRYTSRTPPGPPQDPPPVPLESKSGLRYPCNITAKEAVSAINRATSLGCKQELVDLVCSLDKGLVYPASLPRSCPKKVDPATKGRHMGCFQDSFTKRVLQGHLVKMKDTNSPQVCLEVCINTGFSYSGVQYGLECFCGNAQPQASLLLDPGKCDLPCPGGGPATCGGYLTMDITETGLVPYLPSKLGQEGQSQDQAPVRLVYLLTVAGRASRQVFRLVKRLYSPHHYILVHVDARQEFLHKEMVRLSELLPNLRLVNQRYSTIWGGASLLTMLLSAIKELLAMDDWTDWDFVLNLSESDWPVKKQTELVSFLSANRDNNFVKGHGREQDKFIKKQGLDRTFHQCDNHMWRLGSRSLPLGVQIDGGSDWICLNHDFAEYVVGSEDELVTGLKKVFTQTLLPAESFFHTVLRNSRFCNTYIDNNLHLTNWKRKQGCKCQYKAIVDWCGCSPNDFLPEDWTKLESTHAKQLFFARKFEPIIHQGILNRVDDWVFESAGDEEDIDSDDVARNSYWQNVFHHDDLKNTDFTATAALAEDDLKHVREECHSDLVFVEVKEITTHNFNNKYQGTLLYIKAEHPENKEAVNIEIKVKHKQRLERTEEQEKSRLTNMAVGTEFDLKELIFRNFLNLIRQDSKPALQLEISSGKTKEQIRFGWFSPQKVLVATSTFQINDTKVDTVESVEPSLQVPLAPGVWTVVAVSGLDLLFREQFLVVPQLGNLPEAKETVALTDSSLEKFLPRDPEHRNVINSFRESVPFILEYFEVLDRCGDISCLSSCETTSWSSRYPDSKSEIKGVDPVTGEIL